MSESVVAPVGTIGQPVHPPGTYTLALSALSNEELRSRARGNPLVFWFSWVLYRALRAPDRRTWSYPLRVVERQRADLPSWVDDCIKPFEDWAPSDRFRSIGALEVLGGPYEGNFVVVFLDDARTTRLDVDMCHSPRAQLKPIVSASFESQDGDGRRLLTVESASSLLPADANVNRVPETSIDALSRSHERFCSGQDRTPVDDAEALQRCRASLEAAYDHGIERGLLRRTGD